MLDGILKPDNGLDIIATVLILGLVVGGLIARRTLPKGLALVALVAFSLAAIGFFTAVLMPGMRSFPGLILFVNCAAAIGLLSYGIVTWGSAPKAAGADNTREASTKIR